MHIAEGFLPPAHALGWTLVAAPFVVHGARAVAREVREETGLEVRVGAEVGRVSIPGDGVVYDVTDFVCTLGDSSAVPVPGDDADAVTFADAADLDRLSCTPGLVATLRGWGALPG